MRLVEVNRAAVLETLEAMPARFSTKQVSQHPTMLGPHAPFAHDWNYHLTIGKFLRRLSREPDTVLRYLSPGRGDATWEKTGRADGAAAEAFASLGSATQTTDEDRLAIGPQEGGSDFPARMRFHQSHYRARVLRVPYGLGPYPWGPKPRGSMLTEADGALWLNLLTPEIGVLADRLARENPRNVKRFRLLSAAGLDCTTRSRPMCTT